MNKPLHDRLMAFLRDPAQTFLRYAEGAWSKLLIRVPLDAETDALYLLSGYCDAPIKREFSSLQLFLNTSLQVNPRSCNRGGTTYYPRCNSVRWQRPPQFS